MLIRLKNLPTRILIFCYSSSKKKQESLHRRAKERRRMLQEQDQLPQNSK